MKKIIFATIIAVNSFGRYLQDHITIFMDKDNGVYYGKVN